MPLKNPVYMYDDEGVPLVAYIPAAGERTPVPNVWGDDTRAAWRSDTHPAFVGWSTEVEPTDACTMERLIARHGFVLEAMQLWTDTVRAKGDKYSYITFDGGQFYPVYLRRAGVEEICELKTFARLDMKLFKDNIQADRESLAGARRLLKDELEEGE